MRGRRLAELLAFGVSGDSAPAELLGDLAIPETSAPGLAGTLIEDGSVNEAVVLSTGVMTELYLVADDGLTAEASALTELSAWTGVDPALLAGAAYALEEESAASHLFRIAAGVGPACPSRGPMVERVERAHRLARDAGSAGPVLDRLFTDATGCACQKVGEEARAPVDELELKRWERTVAEEVERFYSWRWATLDGELGETGGADEPAGAAVIRFPRPGDPA